MCVVSWYPCYILAKPIMSILRATNLLRFMALELEFLLGRIRLKGWLLHPHPHHLLPLLLGDGVESLAYPCCTSSVAQYLMVGPGKTNKQQKHTLTDKGVLPNRPIEIKFETKAKQIRTSVSGTPYLMNFI